MKPHYRLSHFAQAAELVANDQMEFCCNALSIAAYGSVARAYQSGGNGGWKPSPERRLFEEVYGVYGNTFYVMWTDLDGYASYPSAEDMREIRLLALCFVHEIARRANAQRRPANARKH
jgi:hypothetical protein